MCQSVHILHLEKTVSLVCTCAGLAGCIDSEVETGLRVCWVREGGSKVSDLVSVPDPHVPGVLG